jgi:MFS family permease
LLNPVFVPVALGWRVVFLLGAILGSAILIFRHWVPESPRWLTIHGRKKDADAIIKGIEDKINSAKKISEL